MRKTIKSKADCAGCMYRHPRKRGKGHYLLHRKWEFGCEFHEEKTITKGD